MKMDVPAKDLRRSRRLRALIITPAIGGTTPAVMGTIVAIWPVIAWAPVAVGILALTAIIVAGLIDRPCRYGGATQRERWPGGAGVAEAG